MAGKVGRRLLALILLGTAVYEAAPASGTFIFTNSGRDPDEFRAFAKIASRLKRYGQVQIDIGVLAGKTTFEMSASKDAGQVHDVGRATQSPSECSKS